VFFDMLVILPISSRIGFLRQAHSIAGKPVCAVLMFNRFVIESDPTAFVDRAHAALQALAARPGYLRGELTRSLDEPEHWCLVTEWESVGAYRRALGGFDVKITATPLLAESLMEPCAYETLALAEPGGEVQTRSSDRAAEGR
jgi:quinol monooxygenase YgiN